MPNSRQSAAKEVLNLYDQIGKEEAIPASVSPDAKKLAVPFAIFRKAVGALDDELKNDRVRTNIGGITREDVTNAYGLLEALVYGNAHPFWRYAAEMRKERAVLPTAQISVGQAYAVGVVRAVRDEQGGSYGDAAARVAVYWAPFLVGPSISRKDLENWNSRLKRDDDAQADEFARHLRERFGGKTASVQRILQASINALRATGFKKE